MNKNLYQIISKLLILIYPNIKIDSYLKPFFSLLNHEIKHNGLFHTIKIMKQMRLHITRYLCGSPLLINSIGISIGKDGWPNRLRFLLPLATGKITEIKFLMTLLVINRCHILTSSKDKEKLIPDFLPITSPNKSTYTIPTGVIKLFVKLYILKYQGSISFHITDIYLNMKAGPLGKSLLFAQEAMRGYSMFTMALLGGLTNTTGIIFLQANFNSMWENWTNHDTDLEKYPIGKIGIVFDPETKVRIIAMLDYFSQLMLKPIHEALLILLKRLPQDRSFTQDPINDWYLNNGQSFSSLDLSNATDRFPIKLQTRLLAEIFSHKLAWSWFGLLTSRIFSYKKREVMYSSGQPMGAYSSWVAFTITHHLVVFYAAWLTGSYNTSPHNLFTQYIILGDDIVIKNDKVAKNYKYIMGKLGVELSLHKTHVSEDTYEFAKRWFKNGVEITGLPFKGIVENIFNPFVVFSVLFTYFKVNGNISVYTGTLDSIINSFYKGLIINRKGRLFNLSLSKITKMKITQMNALLSYSIGLGSLEQIRALFVNLGNTMIVPNIFVVHSLIEQIKIYGTLGSIYSLLESLDSLVPYIRSVFYTKDNRTREHKGSLVIKAIYNYLLQILRILYKYDKGYLNLNQVIVQIQGLNFESIWSIKSHTHKTNILSVGKALMKGFNFYLKYTLIESDQHFTMWDLNQLEKGRFIDSAYAHIKSLCVNLDQAYHGYHMSAFFMQVWKEHWSLFKKGLR